MNEKDKFFEDLKEDGKADDMFAGATPPAPVVPAKEEEKKEEEIVPESVKNRRHRRLEEALQKERESNIALSARVQTLSEMKETAKSTNTDERLYTLYGTEDNGKKAASITQSILNDVKEQAKHEALEEMRAERTREKEDVVKQETVLDGFLDSIEDAYNVDVTSNSPAARKARAGFFDALKELSPKDGDTVTAFADPLATWEHYQLKQSKDKPTENTDRQKELASRSMTRSGNPPAPEPPARMSWDEVNKVFGKLIR